MWRCNNGIFRQGVPRGSERLYEAKLGDKQMTDLELGPNTAKNLREAEIKLPGHARVNILLTGGWKFCHWPFLNQTDCLEIVNNKLCLLLSLLLRFLLILFFFLLLLTPLKLHILFLLSSGPTQLTFADCCSDTSKPKQLFYAFCKVVMPTVQGMELHSIFIKSCAEEKSADPWRKGEWRAEEWGEKEEEEEEE